MLRGVLKIDKSNSDAKDERDGEKQNCRSDSDPVWYWDFSNFSIKINIRLCRDRE